MGKVFPVHDPMRKRLYLYASDGETALAGAREAITKGWFPADLRVVVYCTDKIDLLVCGPNLRDWIAGRASFSTARLIRLDV